MFLTNSLWHKKICRAGYLWYNIAGIATPRLMRVERKLLVPFTCLVLEQKMLREVHRKMSDCYSSLLSPLWIPIVIILKLQILLQIFLYTVYRHTYCSGYILGLHMTVMSAVIFWSLWFIALLVNKGVRFMSSIYLLYSLICHLHSVTNIKYVSSLSSLSSQTIWLYPFFNMEEDSFLHSSSLW